MSNVTDKCFDCNGTGKFGRVSDCYTCQGTGRVPCAPAAKEPVVSKSVAKRTAAQKGEPYPFEAKEPGVRRYKTNGRVYLSTSIGVFVPTVDVDLEEFVLATDYDKLAAQVEALTKERNAWEAQSIKLGVDWSKALNDLGDELHAQIDKLTAENAAMRELLKEARPAVFAQHMHDIGTRVAPPTALFKRIDALLASKAGV